MTERRPVSKAPKQPAKRRARPRNAPINPALDPKATKPVAAKRTTKSPNPIDQVKAEVRTTKTPSLVDQVNAELAAIGKAKRTRRAPAAKPNPEPPKPAETNDRGTANLFDDDAFTDFGPDGMERDRDIVTTEIQPARAFRDVRFANANIALVSDYADYRVMGWNPERAFIRVFGTDYGDMHLFARIEALEHNVVYRQVFAKRFGATPLSRMFSVKHAIWHWLSLLNNPFVKETVRAKAIDSLQVIYGITVVDEAGTTKAAKTLDDFYREEQAAEASNNASNPQGFRHPDPGTPEAIAFEAKMRGEDASNLEI